MKWFKREPKLKITQRYLEEKEAWRVTLEYNDVIVTTDVSRVLFDYDPEFEMRTQPIEVKKK